MSEFSEPSPSDGRQRTGWAELATGETVELARIGARFGARVLDAIIVGVVFFVLILVLAAGSASTDAADISGFSVMGILIGLVVGVGYEVLQIAVWGQTLGKRIVGVKVIHAAHGGLPGWGKAFGRWAIPGLLALIPLVGWILSILCYLSATWDRVYQGWHDKAAGTLVIRT